MAAARKAGVSIRKLNRAILTENYELVQDQLKRLNSRYFSGNLHSEEAKEQIEDLLEGPIA
jgi:hypothetical protein